ncbi:hypothetical protein [Roseinatronobacter sp. S2]|uniref:hypothetical protein n=1 Tax=Roseinatronobacter sp. S2 TaxID=3035471 RepID=UPI00240F73AE|nr:hypothetical protein [Roseinatronobacter sp. S2]WFE75667.1 hypothetical protein P8S53_04440 [Roseinatronobacter sp. S2]
MTNYVAKAMNLAKDPAAALILQRLFYWQPKSKMNVTEKLGLRSLGHAGLRKPG